MRQSDDTVRVDPLNHFKKYRGGYDITNKHYWSSAIFTGIYGYAIGVLWLLCGLSAIFTGIYGYAIGVLWLLCGLVNGGFLLATSFCCKNSNRKLKKKKGSHCHKQCYPWPILLATFFTVLAMFEGDTCTALEDFQRDPYNSSLSSILPCNELLSAKSALSDVSAGIYNLVNEVNANISTSYQNIVQVCNPFSEPPEYQYQPNSCPSNTIKIGDIPRVLKTYTCSDANSGTCEGVLISTNDFRTVEAYSNSIQTLLNAYPGMENLVQCQPVEEAFSEILQRHCKPLKRHTRMVWAALLFLSIIMVAVVLIWTVEAHYQQKRQFSDCSVKSHSMEAELMESGGAKGTRKDSNLNSVL
ncbi:hypothetical protein TEA_012259 [Camellia sinensis var. sinensis]|uniref:Uncharacterized protein n=1 Tax=Camellia sinensis var. sinensis TaxID=542762 RepID=A0A4S4DHL1_CAMSN|nr:hypothetical protein TEA_012259 [Camellia sinensis var. sinensis]